MLKVLRHLLVVLIAFTLGGTTAGFARSPQYPAPMTMAGTPCDVAISMPASGDTKPMAPCKHMTLDCIIGCVMVTALPARDQIRQVIVQFSTVNYRSVSSKLASLNYPPEPPPPRTA